MIKYSENGCCRLSGHPQHKLGSREDQGEESQLWFFFGALTFLPFDYHVLVCQR